MAFLPDGMIESIGRIAMPQKKYTGWILGIALLFGSILRFLPGMKAGFPVNDGGMLLAMIRDLKSNGLILPSVTSYNFLDLPFAYPPLGMYVVALLSYNLPISDLELLRWLPPVISLIIIFAFYWLAYRILDSEAKAASAVLFYALMPGASNWLVMGGGLTRSFGILFSLLAIGYVYRLFCEDRNQANMGLAILFCAFTVLSHPEVGVQTAGVCFVLWAFYGKSAAGLKKAALVVLGTALLTAPWWVMVLRYHGFSPFWSAMHTGIHETLFASLYQSVFTLQGGLPILPILGLIGIVVVLRKREFLLIFWSFLPFLIDPRNAPAILNFPFLLLVSEGVYFLGNGLRQAYSTTFPNSENTDRYLPVLTYGSLAIVLSYLFFVAYTSIPDLVALSLSRSDRETMEWIKANTSPESRFLLITNTGQMSPMADAYQEWFPVLAERQSRNTLQGLEWTLGSDFFPHYQELIALQACPDVDCLTRWLGEGNLQVDYILVRTKRASPALLGSLRSDGRYEAIHRSTTAEIFALTKLNPK